MSSGQQWWAEQQAEAAESEYQRKLASDSERLGINIVDLQNLRNFKKTFNKHVDNLPYHAAVELIKLLDKINTN